MLAGGVQEKQRNQNVNLQPM